MEDDETENPNIPTEKAKDLTFLHKRLNEIPKGDLNEHKLLKKMSRAIPCLHLPLNMGKSLQPMKPVLAQ